MHGLPEETEPSDARNREYGKGRESEEAPGYGGDDYLDGGRGNDTIQGGQGQDTMLGREGGDFLWALFGGNDTLSGGSALMSFTATRPSWMELESRISSSAIVSSLRAKESIRSHLITSSAGAP